MKLRNYEVIGRQLSFQAADDKTAAVIVASLGDYGFVDAYGLEKFPAAWSEKEWHMWLGTPLHVYLNKNSATVAPVIAALRSL